MVENEDLTGKVIAGKYRLDLLIGKGGFGSVYAGEHLAMARHVAIKVIAMRHPKVQQQGGVERFSREARLVSQLQSPHTVSVFDYGVEAGMLYLVMEHIKGETLKSLIKRERGLKPERAAQLTIQMLKSLEEAHHRGILHRDLKPANIMVFRDFRGEEKLKVLDFGIAKVLNSARAQSIGEPDLTEENGFIGTPRYAAPEQLFGQNMSAVTDIYGVGMLLWEMLMGEPALNIRAWGECSSFHITHQNVPMRMPSARAFPKGIVHITERAIMRYARDRWESAAQMGEALERWLEHPESTSLSGSPASTSPSVDDGFWSNASNAIDPNLAGAQQFFAEGGAPGRADLFGGEPAPAPTSLRRPERERQPSTLERADWAGSAEHIPLMSDANAPSRQPPEVVPTPMAPPSASSGSSLMTRPAELVGERGQGRRLGMSGIAAVLGVLMVLGVGGWWLSGDESQGEESLDEMIDGAIDAASPGFNVPSGRFSQEGIWLAVQAAQWRRTSSVETIDLNDVRQYTAFYERGEVTCEITLVEARSEMALHELVSNLGSRVSVVRFDYRAIKLNPLKGAGMHEEVAGLTRHLKAYRKLVIEEQEKQETQVEP
jgi:serine/threonine protein kinase